MSDRYDVINEHDEPGSILLISNRDRAEWPYSPPYEDLKMRR